MIPKSPTFQLPYINCNQSRFHNDQYLNYICLNTECKKSPIICSLCRYQKHKDHNTKPLKYYFQSMYKQYQMKNIDYTEQMNKVEEQRNICLYKFKILVERTANQIQKIEQSLFEYYQDLKMKLIQEKIKKQKFCSFYQSLLKNTHNQHKIDYLKQNYFEPNNQSPIITQIPKLSELFQTIEQQFNKTFSNFKISNKKAEIKQSQQPQSLKWLPDKKITCSQQFYKSLIMPKNIHRTLSTCSQGDHRLCAPSMIISSSNIKQIFNIKNEIYVRINDLAKKSFLYMGVIEKQAAEINGFKFPLHPFAKIDEAQKIKYKDKLYFVSNQGNSFGSNKQAIKTFSLNCMLKISCQKNKLRIHLKKKVNQYILDTKKQYFLFFSLLGKIGVEILFQDKLI